MEVEQHQELEVAQVTSKVYDIIHPTPVSLKQLSAIAISLEIWRRKVNEYRTDGKLKEFDPCILRKETTWMKTMLPDLPSTIYKTIEQVVSRFGYSLERWRFQHFSKGFFFQYSDENSVLEDFDDFSCDYDGSIHYVRTAEHMMRCERFDSEMKFIVACLYFFEDDIRRIWPSVTDNVNIDFIDFHKCPLLYFWTCRLENELHKIPRWDGRTVDEIMFMSFMMPHNRPSVEYFWNRMPLENQMQRTVFHLDSYDFVRFILPKLDDEQLDKYINDGYGADRLYTMFLELHFDEWVVLRTWFHIRNIIKESNFTRLIVRMFEINNNNDDEFYEQEKWEYLCCQIWNHSLPTLKPCLIRVISSDSSWLQVFDQINFELLLTILQDASLEERNLFLRNCWSALSKRVRRKNLQRVIELCFENEDEINQFKQNVVINSRDVLQYCAALLEDSCFEELNAFVSFCCAELQAARNFKQRILQSAYLDQYCILTSDNFSRIGDLNEFVNDAFDNVDVSTEFENMLISSSTFMLRLWYLMFDRHVSSETIIKFITTLFSTEETVMRVKKSWIDSFKEQLTTKVHLFSDPELYPTLLWCLGSNEAVEEFKLNCMSQYKSQMALILQNDQFKIVSVCYVWDWMSRY
ncbi:uncharacterized protein LOC135848934 [Planococcus citri]|uniref:uncharacterized protein LOC135848934 n=1 Tax=Planococcus citri TaxID=170843 RepID=UPI0031F7CE2E